MIVNVVYSRFNHDQYDGTLDPIVNELVRRGHIVKPRKSDGEEPTDWWDAHCTITNEHHYTGKHPRPIFFVDHGCSPIKRPTYEFYVQRHLVFSPRWAEYIRTCVQETWYHSAMPVVVGNPKADLLMEMQSEGIPWDDVKRIEDKIGWWDDEKPLVIYAPTWRKNISDRHGYARDYSLNHAYGVLSKDNNVVVFPHQLDDDSMWEFVPKHRQIYGYEERIKFMVLADLMVSDTSGIMFEFMGLDKPVVAIKNPNDPDFLRIRLSDRHDEYFDGGIISRGLEELQYAVHSALEPNTIAEFSSRRHYWARQALGFMDGRNAERAVDEIQSFTLEYDRLNPNHSANEGSLNLYLENQ